jgi:Holliday junction resolvase RusA-like endonuclease
MITFTVPGTPIGKARPRITKHGAYTPEKTVIAEDTIRRAYNSSILFGADIPLRLCVDAFFPIPQSKSERVKGEMLKGFIRPTKKPDWDNIGKLVSDALNQVAYYDDKQIVECTVRKFYSDRPRLEIRIEEVV